MPSFKSFAAIHTQNCDERRAFFARLRTVTANHMAGPFRSLPMEEIREFNGHVALYDTPFTLVMLTGDPATRSVFAVAQRIHDVEVQFVPYTILVPPALFSPRDIQRVRVWADRCALFSMNRQPGEQFTAEVWDRDSLTIFGAMVKRHALSYDSIPVEDDRHVPQAH